MSDTIYRQDAIDALCDNCDDTQAVCAHYPCKQYIAVEKLPSAEPERKTGKWIHEIVNSYTEKTYCSECGGSAPIVLVSDDYYGVHVHGEDRKTDFCPNCGADMRGDEDG